jgi:uncharacterized membrane protein YdjX (TVP38/TMEM64 family)
LVRSPLKTAVAIAVIVAFLAALRFLPLAAWFEQFKLWVQHAGFTGYALYVLVYALGTVLLLPVFALTIGAGATFGFVKGSLVVIVGATLGACTAFLMARTILRMRVEHFVARRPGVAAVDRAVGRDGVKLMLLCRVSGFPPFTWVNYAFGLTKVSFVQYLATTCAGIIPGVLAFSYAGAAGASALSGDGNRIALAVTAAGAVLVSAYVARLALIAVRRAGARES